MPKIYVFEAKVDNASGYYYTKILMDIWYCTLHTYAKSV